MEFNLTGDRYKPLVELYEPKLICLLDSGAMIPVWCAGAQMLTETFGSKRDTTCKAVIRGFGGNGEIAPIYRLPELYLTQTISFKNMPVALSDRLENNKFDMVLPITIFKEFDIMFQIGKDHRLESIAYHTLYSARTYFCDKYMYQDENGKVIKDTNGWMFLKSVGCFAQEE